MIAETPLGCRQHEKRSQILSIKQQRGQQNRGDDAGILTLLLHSFDITQQQLCIDITMGWFGRIRRKNKQKEGEEDSLNRTRVHTDTQQHQSSPRPSPRASPRKAPLYSEEREGPPRSDPPSSMSGSSYRQVSPTSASYQSGKDDQFLRNLNLPSHITEEEDLTYAGGSMGKNRAGGFSSLPPSARDAAFGGPPRFDWIDIVSSFKNRSCKRI